MISTQRKQSNANGEATIRLDTSLVVVPVTVLDREGKHVRELTKQDFRIYEDNVEQEITHFSAEAPFNVVLMLDTSYTMRYELTDIQRAATAFIESLRPQDQVMVVSYNGYIYVNSEFTADRNQLSHAIEQTRQGRGKRLYDALELLLTERLNQVQGRKAIVLFTDGLDCNGSQFANADETMDLVRGSGVSIYPIFYNTYADTGATSKIDARGGIITSLGVSRELYMAAINYLNGLANSTGAQLYQADQPFKLRQAFSAIAEDLRHQYTLGYYPTNTARDNSYRRIRVSVGRPDIVVRARDGYRLPPDSSASVNR